MKNLLSRSIVIGILQLGIVLSSYSQPGTTKFEFGGNIGFLIYQGDLAPSRFGSYKTKKFGFSIFANRILNNTFSLRTNLAIGKLKGDDARYSTPEYRHQRNFNFKSLLVEISELLVWSPLGKKYDDKGLYPYLFAGVGYSFLNIKRDWSKFNAEYFTEASNVLMGLVADMQHSLPKGIPVLPVGVGIRYSISPRISISGETFYRFTSTDYLDGFSQAADPKKKDNYYTNSINIIYRPGKKNRLKCPVVQ